LGKPATTGFPFLGSLNSTNLVRGNRSSCHKSGVLG
jgi:hypothetical protein